MSGEQYCVYRRVQEAEVVTIVYGYEPCDHLPEQDVLIVDYDLTRLPHPPFVQNIAGIVCAELYGLRLGTEVSSIHFRIRPFTPASQIIRDLFAAAALVGRKGQVRVKVGERRQRKLVERVAKATFENVKADDGGAFVLYCRDPRVGICAPDVFENVELLEPVTRRILRFRTRQGLFSHGHVDVGTSLLLQTLPDVTALKVLDVGCGFGAIGVVTAARGGLLTMLDIDARAVALAQENLLQNGLSGDVILEDGSIRTKKGPFDLVLSNPPTHVGSKILRTLFSNMLQSSRGPLGCRVVVRSHLNYEPWLEQQGEVERLAEHAGFKVLSFRRY